MLMLTHRSCSKRVEDSSLYDLLNLPPDADDEAIKRAVRMRLYELHPDRTGDDPEKRAEFDEVTAAGEVLLDPERRACYDEEGILHVADDVLRTAAQQQVCDMIEGVILNERYSFRQDVLEVVGRMVADQKREVEGAVVKCRRKLDRLNKAVGKLHVVEGKSNILLGTMTSKVTAVKRELQQLYAQRRVHLRMQSILRDYTFEVDESPPMTDSSSTVYGTSVTSSSIRWVVNV